MTRIAGRWKEAHPHHRCGFGAMVNASMRTRRCTLIRRRATEAEAPVPA